MSRRLLGWGGVVLGLVACGVTLDPQLVEKGREAYQREGCAACHGRQGEGGPMGPDLRRLRRHWGVEELTAYLADPAGHRERDARLKRLGGSHGAHMPSFATLEAERRRALAAYLLSR